MIRRSESGDFAQIWAVINDGSEAYRGVIPPDRWAEPYMSQEKLQHEIDAGIEFWVFEYSGRVAGVMGLQSVGDVTLIRHAYVRSEDQRQGIGAQLLTQVRQRTERPILIGTWADALWAIRFYERHGFRQVGFAEKERLLRTYWSVPERQIETSVVLADEAWSRYQMRASTVGDV